MLVICYDTFDKMCSSPFCGLPLTEYDQKDAEAAQPLVVTWEEAQGDLHHLPMNGPGIPQLKSNLSTRFHGHSRSRHIHCVICH